MATTQPDLPPSYWELQKKQRIVSTLLFIFLFIFYLVAIGLLLTIILLGGQVFLPGSNPFSSSNLFLYAAVATLLAAVVTVLNFLQAKKAGASYILSNLRAYPPDPDDRYHLSFINVAEEMKISSGLPRLKTYVIPSVNVNSLSLLDKGNVPAIAVTEGLLAEATRDELQAVVAHEVAHIRAGDTFLLTLICSLTAFYEKFLDSLEKKSDYQSGFQLSRSGQRVTSAPLAYLASSISFLLIKFFTMLVSQNRELLADATAVELSRDPAALSRIIYKAWLANSYLGDTTMLTPLFLVPPDSKEIADSRWSRLFNTHPPVERRLALLAGMTHRTVEEIKNEVRQREKLREDSRLVIKSSSEDDSPEKEKAILKLQEQAENELHKAEVWEIRQASGKWAGAFTLGALISQPAFSPGIRVRNLKENREGRAREFPQIRFALYRQAKNQPVDPALTHLCPACQVPLQESFYEGVQIKICPLCSGRQVRMEDIEKILARQEYDFSPGLKEKASLYQQALLNPEKRTLAFPGKKSLLCPECGLQLATKPFNYYYVFPVYKCYKCQLIWFEPDELEVLQILFQSRED
ncbi:MAG TPA: zinc metalloprotease HtpX [Candidatus Saccharicenans sp.]|nr:zinc metalloprotease HtpX [Candidatus Saccharicenans sp.]